MQGAKVSDVLDAHGALLESWGHVQLCSTCGHNFTLPQALDWLSKAGVEGAEVEEVKVTAGTVAVCCVCVHLPKRCSTYTSRAMVYFEVLMQISACGLCVGDSVPNAWLGKDVQAIPFHSLPRQGLSEKAHTSGYPRLNSPC